jgi:hypothetical protein
LPLPVDRPRDEGGHEPPAPGRPRPLVALVVLTLLTLAGANLRSAAAADPEMSPVLPSDRPLVFDTNLGLIQRATEEAIDRALTGLTLPEKSEIRLFSVSTRDGDWFVEDRIANYLSARGYKVYLVEKKKPGATDAAADVAAPSMGDALKATQAANAPDTTGATTDTTGAGTPAGDPPASTTPPATTNNSANPPPGNTMTGPAKKNPGAGLPGTDEPVELLNEFPEDIEGLVLSFRVLEFGVTYHDQWRQGFLGQRVVERLAAVDLNCRLVSGDEKNILWVGNGRSEKLDIVPKSKLDLLEGRSYPFTRPNLPPQSLSRIVEPALVLGIVGGLVFLFYSNQN